MKRYMLATLIALLVSIMGVTVVALASPASPVTPNKAAPTVDCTNLTHFHERNGTRYIEVSFAPGCKPHMEWGGPATGEYLQGRYGDVGFYMWWFVWDKDSPVPHLGWDPGFPPTPTPSTTTP